MSSVLVARIGGLAGALLLVSIGYLGVTYATSPPAGSFEVTAVLGERAGQGVSAGTDVKARGVIVGEVKDVYLDERARPIAVITIFPDQPLPSAENIALEIGSKTFLGPKQIEIHFDGAVTEPYLSAGDTLGVADGLGAREPVDMFDEFADVMAAIPGHRLGEIYEALGHFTMEDARIAGQNLELSDQMFEFHGRTAELQVRNLTDLADIVEALAPRVGDINRLTASFPVWASLLPDRQADFRRNFESLSDFAEGFAELLEVSEPDLSELILLGNDVLLMMEPRLDQIGEMVYGLSEYAGLFVRHTQTLTDGSQFGWIRVLLPVFEEMCLNFPEEFQESELGEAMPGCPPPDGHPYYHEDEDRTPEDGERRQEPENDEHADDDDDDEEEVPLP